MESPGACTMVHQLPFSRVDLYSERSGASVWDVHEQRVVAFRYGYWKADNEKSA